MAAAQNSKMIAKKPSSQKHWDESLHLPWYHPNSQGTMPPCTRYPDNGGGDRLPLSSDSRANQAVAL